MAGKQITKLKPRHEYMVEWMLANPKATRADIGREVGLSEEHVGIIINSDAFQDYYAKRRMDLAARTDKALIERMFAVADAGLKTMQEKIEEEGTEMSMGALTEATKTALQGLGFGAPKGAQINNSPGGSVTVVQATPELLEQARARMRERQEQETIEGEIVAGSPAAADELSTRGEHNQG